MRRVHLLEIHDQSWFPGFLRDDVTDALQFLLNFGGTVGPIVPRLAQALMQANTHRVVDLCSGAGGPWPSLSKVLRRNGSPSLDILLTDKYPHARVLTASAPSAANDSIHFHAEPVDATHVPAGLQGFRTIFNSFHHFRPAEARGILDNAVRSRQGIGIFEAPGRDIITILLICLMPIGYWLLVPFQRPFTWSRLLWTYLLPVLPFVLFFDGIISCLRIYSPPELRELVAGLPANQYEWQIGVERGGLLHAPITYLVGLPPSPQTTIVNRPATPVLP